MNPDELLEKLKEQASPRACRTLDAIYQICLEQEKRDLTDFSVATIARLGQNRGVPKAQSLRNRTGELYRALIHSFEEKNPDKKTTSRRSAEDDWIDEIKNPKHKLLARVQASELAAANKKLRDFIPPGTRIDVQDHQNEAVDQEWKLNNMERRALEFIVSDDFLSQWGFTVSDYGEIIDTSGTVVLKAATVDAIHKALTHL